MSELKLHIKKEQDEVELEIDYKGNYVAALKNMATLQYSLMDKLVKDGNSIADVTSEAMVVFHEMIYSYVKEHEPEALTFVEAMGNIGDLN